MSRIILFFLTLICLLSSAHASKNFFLIAPQCLLRNIHDATTYRILSTTDSLALVETTDMESFITAKHVPTTLPCGGFIDATTEWKHHSFSSPEKFLDQYKMQKTSSLAPTTYSIHYQKQVNPLLEQINPQDIWTDLAAFSDTQHEFPDRYPNSATGIKAAQWLQDKVEEMVEKNHRDDVSIYTIPTGAEYKQPSVVVKIGKATTPGIVIGAHMDTYQFNLATGVKPGADDDGSGCMTVLNMARILLASNLSFKKPIYLIWYAAEERGLKGSQAVVANFIRRKIPVDAVLQFDMTGFAYQNQAALWLVTDYVDDGLTNFLGQLAVFYVKQPVGRTRCGYACSDHASWKKAGIKAAFPFEASFHEANPYIHRSTDTISLLSRDHMADFVKLGLAFAVELAEPVIP